MLLPSPKGQQPCELTDASADSGAAAKAVQGTVQLIPRSQLLLGTVANSVLWK